VIDMHEAMQACNCEVLRDLRPDEVLTLAKNTNAGTERAALYW
jgi:hypothetical protein